MCPQRAPNDGETRSMAVSEAAPSALITVVIATFLLGRSEVARTQDLLEVRAGEPMFATTFPYFTRWVKSGRRSALPSRSPGNNSAAG